MRLVSRKLIFLGLSAIFLLTGACHADEQSPFYGQLNSDDINLRADSTTASEIICPLKKGSRLYVVQERFEWYKVNLPQSAPCYLKKSFVSSALDNKTGTVLAENVNLRLWPNESSPILGKANTNETVVIVKSEKDWYKIAPTPNSFGWVNKKFVTKLPQKFNKSEKELEKKYYSGPKKY